MTSTPASPVRLVPGARIRVTSVADGQRIEVLTTFGDREVALSPHVRFRGAPGAGDRTAAGWMRGECSGEIEVLPELVLFHGPVTATSLKSDGTQDPDGMNITAKQLQMNRLRETGELVSVQASGGVAVDWRAMHARSRNLELDLKWKRCIADDPDGAAVRFDDGHTYCAPRIEANYATWSVSTWRGRLVREAEASARR